MNDMMNTPMQGGNEMESDSTQQGQYLICIAVDPSGQVSVGVESDSSGDLMGEDDEGPEYKPVADINEALSMAKMIFRNNGQMPEEDTQALEQAQAGYEKKAGPMRGMKAPGGIFGE
jgi:hypothetical protein